MESEISVLTQYSHPLIKGPINSVEVEPIKQRFALCCSENGTMLIYDCFTMSPVSVIPPKKRNLSTDVSWMKYDNGIFSVSSFDGVLRFYSTKTPDDPFLSVDCASPIYSCSFAPTIPVVAASLDDGAVQICDIRKDRHLLVLYTGYEDSVMNVAWSPVNDYVCACSDAGGRIMMFDIRQPKSPYVLSWWRSAFNEEVLETAGDPTVPGLCYSPDGLSLCSYCIDGTIRLWNPDDGMSQLIQYHINPRSNPKRRVGICYDGTNLYVPENNSVNNVTAGEMYVGHIKNVTAVQTFKEGLVSTGSDSVLTIWGPRIYVENESDASEWSN